MATPQRRESAAGGQQQQQAQAQGQAQGQGQQAESAYYQQQRRGSLSPSRRGSLASPESASSRRGSQRASFAADSPAPAPAPVHAEEPVPSTPRVSFEQRASLLKRILAGNASDLWEKQRELDGLQGEISRLQAVLTHRQDIKTRIAEELQAAAEAAAAALAPAMSLSPVSPRGSVRQSVSGRSQQQSKYDAMRRQSASQQQQRRASLSGGATATKR